MKKIHAFYISLIAVVIIGSIGFGAEILQRVHVDNLVNDELFDANISISPEHAEIHDGEHYFLASFTTLNSSEKDDFCVTTPNTSTWTHIIFEFASTASTTLQLYEGATCGSDGTLVTAINSNRNSSNTSGLVIRLDPTVSATGTLLSQQKVGSGTNPSNIIPGEGRRESEVVLKQNTKYLFRITSNTASNVISYRANWYEHDGS